MQATSAHHPHNVHDVRGDWAYRRCMTVIEPQLRHHAAREHLADVDRKIGNLKALRAELNSIVNQCGRGTIADFRIIEALAPTNRTHSDSPSAASGQSGAAR